MLVWLGSAMLLESLLHFLVGYPARAIETISFAAITFAIMGRHFV